MEINGRKGFSVVFQTPIMRDLEVRSLLPKSLGKRGHFLLSSLCLG